MNEMEFTHEYDAQADTITICGVRYAAHIFREFGFGAPGKWLRIVKRDSGVLTVFQTTEENNKSFDQISDFKDQS